MTKLRLGFIESDKPVQLTIELTSSVHRDLVAYAAAHAQATGQTKLAESGRWEIEIVKRSDAAKKFILLPRRWVVERTFALLNRCRRLTRDFEATIASAEAWPFVASFRVFLRRLPPLNPQPPEL